MRFRYTPTSQVYALETRLRGPVTAKRLLRLFAADFASTLAENHDSTVEVVSVAERTVRLIQGPLSLRPLPSAVSFNYRSWSDPSLEMSKARRTATVASARKRQASRSVSSTP